MLLLYSKSTHEFYLQNFKFGLRSATNRLQPRLPPWLTYLWLPNGKTSHGHAKAGKKDSQNPVSAQHGPKTTYLPPEPEILQLQHQNKSLPEYLQKARVQSGEYRWVTQWHSLQTAWVSETACGSQISQRNCYGLGPLYSIKFKHVSVVAFTGLVYVKMLPIFVEVALNARKHQSGSLPEFPCRLFQSSAPSLDSWAWTSWAPWRRANQVTCWLSQKYLQKNLLCSHITHFMQFMTVCFPVWVDIIQIIFSHMAL